MLHSVLTTIDLLHADDVCPVVLSLQIDGEVCARGFYTTAQLWVGYWVDALCSWETPGAAQPVGDNPGGAGKQQILGVRTPVHVVAGMQDQLRQPDEHTEAEEHCGQQPRRQQRPASAEQRYCGQSHGHGGEHRPEHLARRQPLGHQTGGTG